MSAIEWEFDLSATPTADTKTVTFTNDGEPASTCSSSRSCNDGYTVDEAVQAAGQEGLGGRGTGRPTPPPARPRRSTIKKPLEPGHYVLLCPLSGPDGPHYKLGQLQEFDIG